MDVELCTYAANPYLAFRDLKRWAEPLPEIPAGWRATLVMRSGPFAAELPFWFDEEGLLQFLANLREMDRALVGTARLQTPHEDPYVELTVGSGGHVEVHGVLVIYDVPTQRLEFAFFTDQTVLRPLVTDFEAAQHELAAIDARAP